MSVSKSDNFLAHQTHVELYGCDPVLIDDETFIKNVLIEVTDIIGLTVVNYTIHHYSPIGVSGIVVIKESHLAIHTWPEYNYAAIDFFTYQKFDIEKGIEYLQKQFKAKKNEINILKRGEMRKILNNN